MIFTKIWQRYLFFETLKTFFLFLFCFFLLYSLVDYSMHMQEIIKNKRILIRDLVSYYGLLFSKRCDLLLSLSLLIASVKVLISLNKRNELLALQTSGVALHRLTRPFFFIGLICVGLNYINFEILAPKSLNYIDHFEKKFLKKKQARKKTRQTVQALFLEDGTRLLYQTYDTEKKEFFDLFLIFSVNNFYHIKTLKVTDFESVGMFVDHMIRSEKGDIQKVTSYPSLNFYHLNLNFYLKNHVNAPIENRSISNLITMALNNTPFFYENRSIVRTHLYFKLFIPWLSILILMGIIPFCVPSTRCLSGFFIFSITIFSYITFFTVINGCIILAETQVIPPFWAIFTCPIIFFVVFGVRFIKMCVKIT